MEGSAHRPPNSRVMPRGWRCVFPREKGSRRRYVRPATSARTIPDALHCMTMVVTSFFTMLHVSDQSMVRVMQGNTIVPCTAAISMSAARETLTHFDAASRELRFKLKPCAGGRGLGSKVVIGRLSNHGSWVLTCSGSTVARGVEGRIDWSSGGLEVQATEDGVALSSPPGSSSFVMQFENPPRA